MNKGLSKMDLQRTKNLSDFTFKQTYARYLREHGRRENWEEAVARMMSTHRSFYADKGIDTELSQIEQAIKEKRILGSQRALQFGGDAILEKHWRIYNCTSSFCDRPRFFAEALWLLLCGSGVGFSIQKHHVASLPAVLNNELILQAHYESLVIEDSIEGWADALNELVNFFFGIRETYPQFDYSLIRKKGSALRHGGKAPGAFALKKALQAIEAVFVQSAGRKLSPINCLDIVCYAADCVKSGGVRRAALLAMFSKDDQEMMNAKIGDWWRHNGQRARANISATIPRGMLAQEDFNKIIESTKQWGEPGFIFTDSTEFCFNPCVTGRTKVLTEDGYKTVESLYQQGQFDLRIDPRFGKGTYSKTTEKGIFLTGVQDVYKVKTKEGYSVECTANHQIMTSRGWIEAHQLEKGDRIWIFNNVKGAYDIFNNKNNEAQDKQSFDEGLLAGWWSGDGSLSDENPILYFYNEKRCLTSRFEKITNTKATTFENRDTIRLSGDTVLGNISKENRKKVPAIVWQKDQAFKRGYLQGLFSSDGSIQGRLDKKGVSIRLTQNNLAFLEDVQELLLELGIFCTIYENRRPAGKVMLPNGKGGQQEYDVKAVHELVISNENINTFHALINFCLPSHALALENIVTGRKRRANREDFIASFESFEHIGKEAVYDLTEPLSHSFIANGVVVHNCVEICMSPVLVTRNGAPVEEYTLDLLEPSNRAELIKQGYRFESGWQACNLTEVNASFFSECTEDNKEAFVESVRLATMLGTLQAGYTQSEYLGNVSKQILEREALLGVSLTGLANSFIFTEYAKGDEEAKASVKAFLVHLASVARTVNVDMSCKLGIREASRITCVKPSGTASLVLGCAPGVHLEHAKRYLRRNQVNNDSPIALAYKKLNPKAVEPYIMSTSKTEDVVAFAIEAPNALCKADLSAVQFLDMVAMVYETWVRSGTHKPQRLEGAAHNVSNTTIVQDDEWDDVAYYIYENQRSFSGLSFLSATGDYDYIQPPFQAVYELSEINEIYNKAKVKLDAEKKDAMKPIKAKYNQERLNLLDLYKAKMDAVQQMDIEGDVTSVCEALDEDYQKEVSANQAQEKKALTEIDNVFLERMKPIAKRWQDHMDALELWTSLRGAQQLDFDTVKEKIDITDVSGELACSGGKCII